jgi:hypothetical protein
MKADTLGGATNPLAINRDRAHGRTAEGLSATLTLDYFRIEDEVTVGPAARGRILAVLAID